MNLVENIKSQCKEKGITISELSERAGLCRTSIYRWDKQPPNYTKVIAVATALEVSLDKLCGGK